MQVEQAAAEVLECSEAWRKGGATAKPASSILRLLAALDDLPAAAMLNAAYAMDGEFVPLHVCCATACVNAVLDTACLVLPTCYGAYMVAVWKQPKRL